MATRDGRTSVAGQIALEQRERTSCVPCREIRRIQAEEDVDGVGAPSGALARMNHGRAVVQRVAASQSLMVTRDGDPVAELWPVRRRPTSAVVLVERWSKLPHIDPDLLRADIDAILDPSL